jgi:phytoene dehydrogenase-like protein
MEEFDVVVVGAGNGGLTASTGLYLISRERFQR